MKVGENVVKTAQRWLHVCILLFFKWGSFQHESRIIQVANFPLHFCHLLLITARKILEKSFAKFNHLHQPEYKWRQAVWQERCVVLIARAALSLLARNWVFYLIKAERCKVEYYVRFFLLAPIIHLPREGNTTV